MFEMYMHCFLKWYNYTILIAFIRYWKETPDYKTVGMYIEKNNEHSYLHTHIWFKT